MYINSTAIASFVRTLVEVTLVKMPSGAPSKQASAQDTDARIGIAITGPIFQSPGYGLRTDQNDQNTIILSVGIQYSMRDLLFDVITMPDLQIAIDMPPHTQ